MRYIKYIREKFKDQRFPVFTLRDLKLIRGISDSYLKMLIHNLLAKKEIIRITKGVYTFHDDADVVCFAFSPSYYGLLDALSRRHISQQGTNPLVVTLRNVRQGVRQFEGRNYLVRHIDKRLFFGYEQMKQGDFWVPVSDVEKTLIDMLYFKFHVGAEEWSGIMKDLDKKRLREYLKRYPERFRKTVLKEIGKHAKAKLSHY